MSVKEQITTLKRAVYARISTDEYARVRFTIGRLANSEVDYLIWWRTTEGLREILE